MLCCCCHCCRCRCRCRCFRCRCCCCCCLLLVAIAVFTTAAIAGTDVVATAAAVPVMLLLFLPLLLLLLLLRSSVLLLLLSAFDARIVLVEVDIFLATCCLSRRGCWWLKIDLALRNSVRKLEDQNRKFSGGKDVFIQTPALVSRGQHRVSRNYLGDLPGRI